MYRVYKQHFLQHRHTHKNSYQITTGSNINVWYEMTIGRFYNTAVIITTEASYIFTRKHQISSHCQCQQKSIQCY